MTSTPPIGPPPAPEIRRTVTLTKRQWIGMPFLFLIPILALTGLFGTRLTTRHVSNSAFDIHLVYPDRIHYRQQATLRISIQNGTSIPMDTITVTLDTTYMRAFVSIQIVPDVHQPYAVPLLHVAPGERRLIVADITGEQLGRHAGAIVVASRTDRVLIPLSTIVFP